MKSMRMLLALAIAAPLAAQQPDSAKPGMHGMMPRGMTGEMAQHGAMAPMMEQMMGMMSMMGPMMRGMAFDPEHLLARKDALELTPQQVTRLTTLRDAMKTAHDAAHADMQAHMKEMAAVLKASAPDTAQLKTHFQAMQAAMGRAHWAMLVAAAQARAALTDAQRGRVDGWADMMQEHMGQMMGQMMTPQHEREPER